VKVLLPRNAPSSPDPIQEFLSKYRTIAVVGLSSNPMRASHGVSSYMQKSGYKIIPVNPNEREVLWETSYARLADVPQPIEIVDIFRRVENVPRVVDDAIRAGAKVIWMQLGIENDSAAQKAVAAGIPVVMDACIMIEHRKRRPTLRSDLEP
jgi:predicted CoA-binding protein